MHTRFRREREIKSPQERKRRQIGGKSGWNQIFNEGCECQAFLLSGLLGAEIEFPGPVGRRNVSLPQDNASLFPEYLLVHQ